MSKKRKTYLVLGIVVLLVACLTGAVVLNFMRDKSSKTDKKVTKKTYQATGDISWYDEGVKEYTIMTAEQLLGMAELSHQEVNFKGKTVKLGANIVYNEGDAVEWAENAPENEWIGITGFAGTFDGQGHTISGLYADVSEESMAVFVKAEGCVISDFRLLNSYYSVEGDEVVGGIVSRGGATVRRVYTDVIIDCDGWYAGGIFGDIIYDSASTVEECWFDGKINITGRYGGGIAGVAVRGYATISHCLNTGSITSTFDGEKSAAIGGISGIAGTEMLMADCLNVGEVVSVNGRPEVGSVIGVITDKVSVQSVWATEESSVTTVGNVGTDGKLTGMVRTNVSESMKGVDGYSRTDLDFEKYWAVVEDGTPVLAYFAENVPEISGDIVRTWAADTSWFDATKPEYVLTTPEQLLGLTCLSQSGEMFYGKVIRLGADIVYNTEDASKYENKAPLNIWYPIKDFYGMFDGQGHTISGLYAVGENNVGLFDTIASKAAVKNMKITNSYFHCTELKGNKGAGGLAGAGGGTISDIYVDAIISGDGFWAGGILGALNQNGSISNCWFAGKVTVGSKYGGGIVGGSLKYKGKIATEGTIEHCLNTGIVCKNKKDTFVSALGGIIGCVVGNTMSINDCFNSGLVTSARIAAGTFDEIGSITGCIASSSKCKIDHSWATAESCGKTIFSLKDDADYTISVCSTATTESLKGYGACYLTTLDFSKYWTPVSDGTPVLKTFASKLLGTNGNKTADTSWYKKNAKTYVLDSVEDLYGFAALSS